MTKRDSILAAMATACLGTTGAGSRVFRSRTDPMAQVETPSIVIEPQRDEATMDVLSQYTWSLTVRVAVFAQGAIPDQSADPIVEEVHEKLVGDSALNALILGLDLLSVEFETAAGAQPVGVTDSTYRVRYRTGQGDLS